MRLRAALLATSLLAATPFAAKATTITGPYVDIGGGYNLTQTQHMRDAGGDDGNGEGRLGHRHGWTGFGSVGWGFGNGLRAEVEGAYNWSEIYSKARGDKGSDRSYGGFVNVLYDIDLKRLFNIDVPVTPFVGVGAGYLWENMQKGAYSGAYNQGAGSSLKGTNGSFAYQGIVGAAYDIPGVPGLQMTTEYRMVGQVESFGMGNIRAEDGSAVRFDHRFNHQFIVGVRYAFNNAPPPPPPAPAVVPPAPTAARTYLVFFDWDGAALTGRSREIVAEAAQASTHVQTTRIEVNGYTDNTSAHPGPRGEKYNLGLSMRRADSVKAELIRDGVPANAIDIHGYGEAHPLVPTGPDTREPQNRRVEIILH
ncbi:OmpA family protein [Komagataeibacter xylinus]|uniref:OmpA family protein n=1 Tax=Komagataeibacter xylinus TaxID=28448 RepID=UPI00280B45C3|nr:OmpA family protein [Komagataeibacter xylinus]